LKDNFFTKISIPIIYEKYGESFRDALNMSSNLIVLFFCYIASKGIFPKFNLFLNHIGFEVLHHFIPTRFSILVLCKSFVSEVGFNGLVRAIGLLHKSVACTAHAPYEVRACDSAPTGVRGLNNGSVVDRFID
jgi:hypothetical protein